MSETMRRHFVTFYSPGTFVSESTTKPIGSWSVKKAQQMATTITERLGATPFGFRFTTRARSEKDLDSKVVRTSKMYYINCKVETLAQIKRRKDPKDAILISNMKSNKWDKVVTTTKGWRCTLPLEKGDVVL